MAIGLLPSLQQMMRRNGRSGRGLGRHASNLALRAMDNRMTRKIDGVEQIRGRVDGRAPISLHARCLGPWVDGVGCCGRRLQLRLMTRERGAARY